MIYFSTNRYELSLDPNCDYQYEVLNELKDGTSGKIENLLKHTRFVFEIDTIPLKEQWEMIKPILDNITRVVYSGGKSLHTIIEFEGKYETFCKDHYVQIWNFINDEYFKGKADTQCKNPNRLTRRPNAYRWDEKHSNVKQTLLYNEPGNYYKNAEKLISSVNGNAIANKIKTSLNARPVYLRNNVDCSQYEVVKRYLETPFPNQSGNGVSNVWLYAALQCTKKYGDNATQQKIIMKAKSEGWTDREIQHKLKG